MTTLPRRRQPSWPSSTWQMKNNTNIFKRITCFPSSSISPNWYLVPYHTQQLRENMQRSYLRPRQRHWNNILCQDRHLSKTRIEQATIAYLWTSNLRSLLTSLRLQKYSGWEVSSTSFLCYHMQSCERSWQKIAFAHLHTFIIQLFSSPGESALYSINMWQVASSPPQS